MDRAAAQAALEQGRKLIAEDRPTEAIAALKRSIVAAPDKIDPYLDLFRYYMAINDCRQSGTCQCDKLTGLLTILGEEMFDADERAEIRDETKYCQEHQVTSAGGILPTDLAWAIVEVAPMLTWWSMDGQRKATLSGGEWVIPAGAHRFQIGRERCASAIWSFVATPRSRTILAQPLRCEMAAWPQWTFYAGLGLTAFGLVEGLAKERHQGKNEELYLREQWIANGALNVGIALAVVGGGAWAWEAWRGAEPTPAP